MIPGIQRTAGEIEDERKLGRQDSLNSFYRFVGTALFIEITVSLGKKFGYDCLMN